MPDAGSNNPLRVLHSEYEARLKSSPPLKSPPRTTARPPPNAENCNQGQQSSIRPAVTSPSTKTHSNCPPRRSKCIYSDRFVPSRLGSNVETGFSLLADPPSKRAQVHAPQTMASHAAAARAKNRGALSMLLQSEYLGMDMLASPRSVPAASTTAAPPTMTTKSMPTVGGGGNNSDRSWDVVSKPPPRNLFRFQASPRQAIAEDFSTLTPLHRSTFWPPTPSIVKERKVSKSPFKILDAPKLQDDFYLNLVDWSSRNVLAVGLGTAVYLWSACTSNVTKLCELGPADAVASVAWTLRGDELAVGTNSGMVQIWDTQHGKCIRTMQGHTERVGTLAWNSQLLATGGRDKSIYVRDVRSPTHFTAHLQGHRQEVCGLRWSFDDQQLASGGNDNKLLIWNCHTPHPITRFHNHTAAVKAIAWSPHQAGLLASGGGTADRCIRFWNTLHGTPLQAIDTGSQVCNLLWSKNSNEVVSTHGYSLNQIIVWKYPTMTKVATLTGHTYRVLYLAMSPDGQTIVTGAGDETLRFWNAFPSATPPPPSGGGRRSLLLPIGGAIR
ncbi:Aste57867_13096 [Aphanomyces stellatus]|uniref:Aste57867_13096 protein n=1 Tax=Aphanomyces stellatus TaxID=120398 RepID=A0A485KXY4_9STRA|nr:hypothetical protein As57867_013048 [Aphanomyces stellatus]VFT89940.1 Aste57867_13096 [Aphanomyces stellatus]